MRYQQLFNAIHPKVAPKLYEMSTIECESVTTTLLYAPYTPELYVYNIFL